MCRSSVMDAVDTFKIVSWLTALKNVEELLTLKIKWIETFEASTSVRQTTEGHISVDLHDQVAFEWRKFEPWTASTQYHCANLPLSWHWCMYFLPPADRLLQPTCSHITELDKCKKYLHQRCQIIPDKLFNTFVCSCNISCGGPVVSENTTCKTMQYSAPSTCLT